MLQIIVYCQSAGDVSAMNVLYIITCSINNIIHVKPVLYNQPLIAIKLQQALSVFCSFCNVLMMRLAALQ